MSRCLYRRWTLLWEPVRRRAKGQQTGLRRARKGAAEGYCSPPLMDRIGVSSRKAPPSASTEMELLSMPNPALWRRRVARGQPDVNFKLRVR